MPSPATDLAPTAALRDPRGLVTGDDVREGAPVTIDAAGVGVEALLETARRTLRPDDREILAREVRRLARPLLAGRAPARPRVDFGPRRPGVTPAVAVYSRPIQVLLYAAAGGRRAIGAPLPYIGERLDLMAEGLVRA